MWGFPMQAIIALLICLLFPFMATAKKPRVAASASQQELKVISEKIKKPDFVVKMMSTVKTQGALLNILRRHISASDLRALKQQGDLLKINFRSRLKINRIDSKSFSFEDKSKIFTYSANGKGILLGTTLLKIDRTQSLMTNYKTIAAQLRVLAGTATGCGYLISCAHADTSSMAFNLTTLLYYMDLHNTGDGNVLWDYFLESPGVREAIKSMASTGKKIERMACDDLGMSMEYSDGAKSYVTWNGKEGEEFDMTISETPTAGAAEQMVSGVDRLMTGNAWFYYCTKLTSQQRDSIVQMINMNYLSPENVQEDHGTVEN